MFFLLSVQTIFGSHQLTYDRPKRWRRQTEQLQLTFSEVIVFFCVSFPRHALWQLAADLQLTPECRNKRIQAEVHI